VLDENRFLAARDGVEAELVDPLRGRAVGVHEIATELMHACGPHAVALSCGGELDQLADLLAEPGPARQRALAARAGLDGLAAGLALDFKAPLPELLPDAA
jgi:glutamate---cysteine ligase / carboxylate-amine ligase